MRELIGLLVVMIIALAIMPVAYATDVEGNSVFTGKVTVRASQPTVAFNFYSDSGYTSTTTQFTPQTPVYMKIDVTTSNQLGEATIVAHLFADTNNAGVGTPPASTSPESYVNFTIYYDTTANQWTLTSDTGGSSTWNIQLDTSQTLPAPTDVSGSFYVIITFGKTAREANTGDTTPAADWDVIVNVTVGSGSLSAYTTQPAYGYTVFFYSETTLSGSTVDFGTIEAGQSNTIQQVDGSPATSLSVTVIANGFYDIKLISDPTWSDGSGNTITLTTTSPGTGEFELQADPTDNFVDPTDAVVISSDLTTTGILFNDQNPTTESGASHTFYMQITLGPNGIHTGTYSGSITLYAVDGK